VDENRERHVKSLKHVGKHVSDFMLRVKTKANLTGIPEAQLDFKVMLMLVHSVNLITVVYIVIFCAKVILHPRASKQK
jgi:hypothetical protein